MSVPDYPKLTTTSQFLQKSLHRFFPDSRLQNKEEEKKENELVFLRKLIFLKSKINRCFLLLSLLEPLMQSNLDANVSRKIATSPAVLDHMDIIILIVGKFHQPPANPFGTARQIPAEGAQCAPPKPE